MFISYMEMFVILILKFIEICFLGSNGQQTSTSSYNGLVSIRQQAIISSKDGLV